MKQVSSSSAIILAAVAFTLAASACSKDSSSPASPSAPSGNGTEVKYAAVGASDANGVGSSAPCLPYVDCPGGMGYVPVIERRLEALNNVVTTTNLGIPGAFIGPDFGALADQYGIGFPTIPGYDLKGNLIDSEVLFVPRDSTLVTVFAGGNDVRTVAHALNAGAGGSDPQAFLNQQIANFRNDYNLVLSTIKSRAPSARIVVANLPNFAGLPYTKNYSSSQKLWVQKISVGFSTQVINGLTSQGVMVVDLLCDGAFSSSSMFSSDGFHPNDTGYAAMADRFVAAITSTSYPSPSSSCSQMTLVK